MASLSQEEAKDFINDLAINNGGLPESDRRQIQDLHPRFLLALDNVRKQLGSSLATLTKNLYTKDARFVYELVQNAEDNEYTQAVAENSSPFLSIRVTASEAIIDSNEDGFTKENIEAICSVGRSTKALSQGYIGEKGIGFKSVFKVASKVHIQSGPFAFAFKYPPGDQGIGMVTPIAEEHHSIPRRFRTRFILTWSDPAKVDKYVYDLERLPDNFLLFLRKIKHLEIEFDTPDQKSTVRPLRVEYICESDALNHFDKISKITTTRDNHRVKSTERFWVFRKTLQNLPQNEARKIEIEKDKFEYISQAEVILAFPVDKDSKPFLRSQQVFAFLPIRTVGFNFVVQSDFIVQANREDLIDSLWNEALLDGAAGLFMEAVLEFCDHPTFQYDWLSFLPEPIWDPLWQQLSFGIIRRLLSTPILRTRRSGVLRLPSQVRRLSRGVKDEHGEPLFDDLQSEVYLAAEYVPYERRLKEILQIKTLGSDEIVQRFEADLENGHSRYKSPKTSDEWHTRTSKLLLKLLKYKGSVQDSVRGLPLIPLITGTWDKFISGTIFPDCQGARVPSDLQFRLVDPQALENSSRKDLFQELSVRDGKLSIIKNQILQRYSQKYPRPPSLENSILHLRFLFWHSSDEDAFPLSPAICILDEYERPIYPSESGHMWKNCYQDDIYFDSDGHFEMADICCYRSEDVESYCARFLHASYLGDYCEEEIRNRLTWKNWLTTFARIRRVPRLEDPADPHMLSEVFEYILAHRPDRLLGTLHKHWFSYKPLISPDIKDALCEAEVPSRNVGNVVLKNTFFPTKEIRTNAKELGLENNIPFLSLPLGSSTEDWLFLKLFGVSFQSDLKFAFEALRVYMDRLLESDDIDLDGLSKIYEKIYVGSQTESANFKTQREFFDYAAIYIPCRGENLPAMWVDLTNTVWQGPEALEMYPPLSKLTPYEGNTKLRNLFVEILELGDANWKHCLKQLRQWKADSTMQNRCSDVYQYIRMEWEDFREDEVESIRIAFQEESLIFIPRSFEWKSTSDCLWVSNTYVSDKIALEAEYPDLSDFFVDMLEVPEQTLSTFVAELQRIAEEEIDVDIETTKNILLEASILQPTKPDFGDWYDSSAKILPTRLKDGQNVLSSPSDPFVIMNSREYARLFDGKVDVLAFSFEEIHDLKDIICALNIENHYVSWMVSEDTCADGTTREERLTFEFRQKAGAFFRCAVHFNSIEDDDRTILDRFSKGEVLVSDNLTKVVSLSFESETLCAEESQSYLHFETAEDRIRLFVPKSKKARSICYLKKLAASILDYLKIGDPEAQAVFNEVLKADINIVEACLDEYGIIEIPGIEIPDGTTDETSQELGIPRSSLRTLSPDSRGQRPCGRSRSANNVSEAGETTTRDAAMAVIFPRARSRQDNFSASSGLTASLGASLRGRGMIPALSSFNETEILACDHEYHNLLDTIIQHASNSFRWPRKRSDTWQNAEAADFQILPDTVFGTRSENQMLHDSKVGAAGELFAYEALKRVLLTTFSYENWRSTIRKFVIIHEKYRDMQPWRGYETADIVYEDKFSALTTHLINLGYLPSNTWAHRKPRYYIEVKTTRSDCKARFYVSKSQYTRMESMKLSGQIPRTKDEIYLILRIYKLGQKGMGMRILLDPATLEQEGHLVFEPESYTVLQS